MSYDITFIKNREGLTVDTIDSILEETDSNETDMGFISVERRKELISKFISSGLEFEVFENLEQPSNSYFELNFATYQVSLFNNQVAVSLPYWDENETDTVTNEVSSIVKVLLDNGFVGYDSQTGDLIKSESDFSAGFTDAKQVVSQYNDTLESNRKSMRYIWMVVLILVIVFITTQLLNMFGY